MSARKAERIFLMSFKRRGRLAALLLLCACVPARADGVDDYVLSEMRKRHLPAVAVVVIREGKVVKEKAYGLANVELKVAADEETLFQIASTTKAFTATAVMSLVEEGKISLDERVRRILPQLPLAWNGVTVRHLLTHTSGLPDVVVSEDSDEVIAQTRPEALRKLARMPVRSRPGAKWAYNQTGYVLLGMIIEKVSGVGFEEFMARRFFRPLGMTHTRFGDDREVVAGRASMYTRYEQQTDQKVSPAGLWTYRNLYPTYLYMAAGLNTTVGDMANWDIAMTEGRILKPSTLEEMWRPVRLSDGKVFRLDDKTLGYGCGWLVDERPGHKAVGHTGSDATAYLRFLDDHLSVVVLTNCQGAQPSDLAFGIAALYVPALAQP
jgi:CubicO group peptidase (beta-lactamase class C family)